MHARRCTRGRVLHPGVQLPFCFVLNPFVNRAAAICFVRAQSCAALECEEQIAPVCTPCLGEQNALRHCCARFCSICILVVGYATVKITLALLWAALSARLWTGTVKRRHPTFRRSNFTKFFILCEPYTLCVLTRYVHRQLLADSKTTCRVEPCREATLQHDTITLSIPVRVVLREKRPMIKR